MVDVYGTRNLSSLVGRKEVDKIKHAFGKGVLLIFGSKWVCKTVSKTV